MQVSGEDASTVIPGGAKDNGAGAVAEQHAGGAVPPVNNAGEGLGADEQNRFGLSRLDEVIGDGKPVDEAGTNGLDVKSGAFFKAQLCLNLGGDGREGVVRGG